jgi:hypothetical protein
MLKKYSIFTQNNRLMAIPDRFHRQLQRLIEKAQPKTLEELQELMNSLQGQPLPEIPEEEVTPDGRALDLIDEAWSGSAAKGQQLARQALELWPDCITAYEFLSATAKSKKQRLGFIEKAVEIGQRLFGGEFLKENAGHFWGITETRPYMRCLQSLAQFNAGEGNLSKAIVIWEDMLRLNPSDNQGIRYSLLPALLRQRDLKSYREYCKKYPEDTAPFSFNDALAAFMEKGGKHSSNDQLAVAAKINPYIIPMLLHEVPPAGIPGSYMLGSPEEAQIYASDAWHLWREIPGALAWLREFQTGQKPRGSAQPLDQLPRESLSLLLSDPYSPASPLQLSPGLKDEDVAHLPFLQLTRALLGAIQKAEPLKLTQQGYLPRALVHALYDLRFFPNKYVDDGKIKLLGVKDFSELLVANVLCELAKLIQKRKGKASLTKKGLQLLQGPQAGLYRELLETYTQRYNWAYTEGWSFGVTQTGQMGWAMIMYELIRQGDTPKGDKYYADQYLKFFPELVKQYPDSPYSSAASNAKADFRRRFFSGLAALFGLVEIVGETMGKHGLVEEYTVRRSELGGRVIEVG